MTAVESELARDPAALAARLAAVDPTVARSDVEVVRAPGRVNLIGEHTDYNDGLVLPVAIDRWVSIAFVRSDDGVVRLTREDDAATVEIELADVGGRDGTWRDYVAGTVWAMRDAGAWIRGFRGLIASDLPMGAGLSSSAALELAVAFALGGGRSPIPDRMALAQAARRAENEFVGVPCGLMDQFAVTFGEPDAAIVLDCRSLRHEVVPLPGNVAILVCDSGVERRLAASAYSARRDECRRAVDTLRWLGEPIETLRDVDPTMLHGARDALDDVAFRRARHVVTENARVLAVEAALRQANLAALGPPFAASHRSLRDDFEVSTPELDALVEIASDAPGVLAARMTGAGFGGAVVALVEAERAADATAAIRDTYRTPKGEPPVVLRVRAAGGAEIASPRP